MVRKFCLNQDFWVFAHRSIKSNKKPFYNFRHFFANILLLRLSREHIQSFFSFFVHVLSKNAIISSSLFVPYVLLLLIDLVKIFGLVKNIVYIKDFIIVHVTSESP
jgi:hypothetical protein